ncbi:Hypothetical Protein FCC1311_017612 [Hondaea fermentalgiana]|uniref:Cilia- and flagella-associated protein 36 n=1 Tax=Hondaea fermentalgiana TaxID=2315210 RepID=A0A2R5G838_9STRA|nr:Hypothetical Protein FCC1311_017612 [Hondaea fermentalgiana]|eukprot:GBG27207.1 Hypothetical Protein FCC1311_017612 [Hondaea fermentalgiana]
MARKKSKSNEVPKEEAIIISVAQLLVSKEFREGVFSFMEDHAASFATENPGEAKAKACDFEHPLEYKEIHAEFSKTFEDRIENHVKEQGSSRAEMYDYLRRQEEAKVADTGASALVQTLLTVFEYETFVEVMRDTERRKYLEHITRSWASTLQSA